MIDKTAEAEAVERIATEHAAEVAKKYGVKKASPRDIQMFAAGIMHERKQNRIAYVDNN